jgi:catechol 2,3-dioxygenase
MTDPATDPTIDPTATPAEPMFDIAHLGRVELLTPDLAASTWYFRDLLGMEVVHADHDSAYLRGFGDHATSTLKLSRADAPGVAQVSWRATSPQALTRRVAALEAAGLGIGWDDGGLGRGRCYRFTDPEGHPMDVYYDEQRYVAPAELRSTLKNLPQKFTGRGATVRRLDHLALLCKDVAANRRFAAELMGFRLREQVMYDEGRSEIGSWMSVSAVHHEVAFVADVRQGTARLHHCAFWLDNREDVLRTADLLSENGIFIEAGPSKHNNSQAFYLYSYEPGGNRIEVYSGSFLVLAPDFEPVTWNEEERGTGVYWGSALPASFLEYATPDVAVPAALPEQRVPVFDPR